ncbi:MAG: FkbM family methyltransferase [Rhodospirillaceae bacterium]
MHIFDLGINNGDDTEYYLKLGYKVVALDADPFSIDLSRKRFQKEITSQNLILINRAFASETKPLDFYVNKTNSHWSSVNLKWASREQSIVQKIEVEGITLKELFETYGVPHFIKIDIEGSDLEVLKQLQREPASPPYISIEDCHLGYEYLRLLKDIGYKKFCISDQSRVQFLKSNVKGHSFPAGSSGPFGPYLPFRWFFWQEFIELYSEFVRGKDRERIAPLPTWWDIHATTDL